MAEQQSFQSGAITGINVTPLVDIMLVLLIIFMVTAKIIHGQRSMALDLPRAVTGNQTRPSFSIVLTRFGRIEVNGRAIASDDELLAKARLARVQRADLRATIEADAGALHGRVMEVLDLLRRAGLSKVAFAVDAKDRFGSAKDVPADRGALR
jgi:biopolymer transport protein ExbD